MKNAGTREEDWERFHASEGRFLLSPYLPLAPGEAQDAVDFVRCASGRAYEEFAALGRVGKTIEVALARGIPGRSEGVPFQQTLAVLDHGLAGGMSEDAAVAAVERSAALQVFGPQEADDRIAAPPQPGLPSFP